MLNRNDVKSSSSTLREVSEKSKSNLFDLRSLILFSEFFCYDIFLIFYFRSKNIFYFSLNIIAIRVVSFENTFQPRNDYK